MLNSEGSSPSTWRFSMELLSHVHTLRVFLLPSSSQVQPAQDYTNFEAALLSAPPALSCSWKAARDAAVDSLRLPLPVLLFDYSSPPNISALLDCIQLTVHLLPLPSHHLYSFSSLSLNDTPSPDVFGAAHIANHSESDPFDDTKGASCEDEDTTHQMGGTMKSLRFSSSTENDTCYDDYSGQGFEHDCTYGTPQSPSPGAHNDRYECSSNVNQANKGFEDTQQSLEFDGAHLEIGQIASPSSTSWARDRIEMNRKGISPDVKEACPNVIHSHRNGYNLDQFPHVEPSLRFQPAKEERKTHRCATQCIVGAVDPSKNPFMCQHTQAANKPCDQCDNLPSDNVAVEHGSQDCAAQGAATFVCKNCLTKVSRKPVRSFVQLPCFDWREVAENWFGACCCSFGSAAEMLSVSFERILQLRPGKCLVGPSTFYVDFSDVTVKEESGLSSDERNTRQSTTTHFLAFGDGFMVWENQQSKVINWFPVRCTSCASLIGAYPHTSSHCGSSKEGLHLFRCQVITCHKDATFDNETYRFKTFKDLLLKELRLRTDENTTYRFLVRSLSSMLPLLQMVVLNYDALICTGRISADVKENSQCMSAITGSLIEAGLQQSIKVLFLDCSRFSGDDVRSADLWVKEHDAETVFMLDEFVDRLREELLANCIFCPATCGLFQGFMSSFLYTMQD
ncbi:hypothetical protein GOP47_0005519 [Adiantum capillus-veneris]|uniref:Uncharacterized protein n=1 Tax=Adiantum capillus-veneris TaxID=13818 RepID=A0A9D4V584_ADICA|nr:hypothetical protein GOP47_0005519 [Adiantum capillus-veneris]